MSLSWVAKKRGLIYCSPACGSGCTRAAFDAAIVTANNTLAKIKTRGWRACVWENMGWHWCLENDLCGLSLHVSGNKFYCMLASGDSKRASHGSYEFPDFPTVSNPNTAINAAIVLATPIYEAHIRGFENLKSIKQKGSK